MFGTIGHIMRGRSRLNAIASISGAGPETYASSVAAVAECGAADSRARCI